MEFIYSFALATILTKTFLLWVFDLLYKNHLCEVLTSMDSLQQVCNEYTEHVRLRKWNTINNFFTAFYCFIVILCYIMTPIKLYLSGVW